MSDINECILIQYSFTNTTLPSGWTMEFSEPEPPQFSRLYTNYVVSFCKEKSNLKVQFESNTHHFFVCCNKGRQSFEYNWMRPYYVCSSLSDSDSRVDPTEPICQIITSIELGDMLWYMFNNCTKTFFKRLYGALHLHMEYADIAHRGLVLKEAADVLVELRFPEDVARLLDEYVTGDLYELLAHASNGSYKYKSRKRRRSEEEEEDSTDT